MPAYAPVYLGIYASNFMTQIGMHLHMHLHIKNEKKMQYVPRDLNQSKTLTNCRNGRTIMKKTMDDFPALIIKFIRY